MVLFPPPPPPTAAQIQASREGAYDRLAAAAQRAEVDNKWVMVYQYQSQMAYYAGELQEASRPAPDLNSTFEQLNAAEQLQVVCLRYHSRADAGVIKSVLSHAIEQTYRPGSGVFPMELQATFDDASTLSKLKSFLLKEILTYEGATKEKALWAALIPGSVLREIIHVPTAMFTSRGTSMGRGTFKEVIDALVALLRNKTKDCQAESKVDETVVATLQALKVSRADLFNYLLVKLQTHAPSLVSELPSDLQIAAPAATFSTPSRSQSIAGNFGNENHVNKRLLCLKDGSFDANPL